MNSLEVISSIVQTTPNISQVTFHSFPKQCMVQDSNIEWGGNEQFMFERALEFKQMGLSFWDGIMLSAFNNSNFSDTLLQQALRHNSHPQLTYVAKQDLMSWFKEHETMIDSFAFCSKVITINNEEQHLPLIDFHIPVSEINVRVVESVCRLLGLSDGWLLNSGESYHFIGSKTVTDVELEQLLFKALMFTPIIDKAWISHQLREHSCSLRMGKKRGVYPEVVKKL